MYEELSTENFKRTKVENSKRSPLRHEPTADHHWRNTFCPISALPPFSVEVLTTDPFKNTVSLNTAILINTSVCLPDKPFVH